MNAGNQIKVGITAVALVSVAALAQYSIDWSTINGGGNTATGGSYSLSGTIGQPDAETSVGGTYELFGGFWAVQAIQVAGGPWLDITLSGTTNVVVSWTPDPPGWILQHNNDLTTNNWADAASGSTNPISIPASEIHRFYRLRKFP